MKRLTKLADKYGTDKGNVESAHLYTEFYEPFFEKYESPKILEIGTWEGGSAHMFNEYFDGDCEIYTCDILETCREKVADLQNAHFFQVDAGSEESIKELKERLCDVKFDIIIDDASHIWRHQMNCLKQLHSLLSDNGIYIIEDIHYSRMYPDMQHSPLFFITFLTPNIMLSDEENAELLSNIKDVQIMSRKNDSELMAERFGGRSITAILTFTK